MPVSTPDNGTDVVEAEDDTETGSIWNSPQVFLGETGRAGATARLRGPGGATPPAANAWPLGRVLQAVGFTEIRNATPITGTAQTNALTGAIKLAAAESAVADFYKGYPIQHATAGTGVRANTMIRGYDGATKVATLMETMTTAISAGSYTIPAGLFYILGDGVSVPLLSASVWRHKKRYNYRDCAVSSFALNIPVNNRQNTDLPSIEFAMTGIPVMPQDEDAPVLPDALLTPIPPAKAGKFALNGIKMGSQSMRIEFGLETGAAPNQNMDDGEESQLILSGDRTITMDINQQLMSEFNPETLVSARQPVSIMSVHGLGVGNTFVAGVANALLKPFSPQGRNGFVGLNSTAEPKDILRSISLALIY